MSEFVATSGVKVTIGLASWKEVSTLRKAIVRELSKSSLSLDSLNVSAKADDLIRTVLQLDGSDDVDAALWPCLVRCTRAGEKITPATFDDGDARRDYYEIVFGCIKENLAPLSGSQLLKLLAAFVGQKLAKPTGSQE